MKPVFHNVQQNSEEWLKLRQGKFTMSKAKDLFMGKQTAGYQKAIYQPVYERLTDESPESFTSDYMNRGHELEPFAVEEYEFQTFNDTTNGGFWTLGEWIGASPDRMVGDDGLLEIKSPAFNTMINYLLKGQLPSIYHWQVYGQMYVTGRQWCDFMAYHPKLKSLIIRIERDEQIIKELKNKLNESIDKAQSILYKLSGIQK